MRKYIKVSAPLLWLFLLSLMVIQGQERSIKLKVVAELANIRQSPDIGSIIIHQALQGRELESTGKEGEWYIVKIRSDEGDIIEGYVHESLVIVTEQIPLIKPLEERIEPEKIKKEEEPSTQQPIPATLPSAAPAKSNFELYLSGGGIFLSGGDLNRGAKGLADYRSYDLGIEGKGKVKPVRLSYILGGELSFPLSSNFHIGLGVDYFLSQERSQVRFEKGSSSDILETRPKIQAFPIRFIISFYPFPFFYAKTGFEYYFAKCAYFYRFHREGFWEEWDGEAEAQDIGFIGGLGFDWPLSPHFSFIVEATGRYARIKGFEGKNKYKTSEGLVSTEEGSLYLYQTRTPGGESYPLLFIREKKPTEAGVFDPQEATIDFSGLSLKAGFKIKF